MPITQSRLIALLDANADYRLGMDKAVEIVRRNYTLYKLGHQTAEQSMENTALMVTYDLLKDKSTSDTTYQVESIRLSMSRRRHNEKAAQDAQERRNRRQQAQIIQDPPLTLPDLPEVSPFAGSTDVHVPSYEEEFPDTYCRVCTKSKLTEYCGLPPKEVKDFCPLGKPADPASVISSLFSTPPKSSTES